MAIIMHHDLAHLRREHSEKRIVFSSGGFDLTHPGHVLFFEDCKKHGDILVVGVGGDAIRRKEKGPGRPIFNEHMRLKMVASLKPVDYAFIIRDDEPIDHHLDSVKNVCKALRPDVYVVNQDAFDLPYRHAMARDLGIELVVLDRWCPPE
jgi:cytidyltransferase-like protein